MRLFLYGACTAFDLCIAAMAGPGATRWLYLGLAGMFVLLAVTHKRYGGES
jgi:hypothetical protein